MILNIDIKKNTKIYHSAHKIYAFSRKLFSKVINPGYHVVLIALIPLLSLRFMYDFMKVNNNIRQYGNAMIHPNHTRNYLELYSLHHLKPVDGDIESNPGPVDNNRETPKGRGRPKKGCAKKLNFNKVPAVKSNVSNEYLRNPVCKNDTIEPEVIAVPIAQDNSIEPVASASSSNMSNDDFEPVTDDIFGRKFPVKLQNDAMVCFFKGKLRSFFIFWIPEGKVL